MQEIIDQLKLRQAELTALEHATAVLSWDQSTYMPVGGAEDRGNAMAVLADIIHHKSTDPAIGEKLGQLSPYIESLDPNCDDARWYHVTRRNFEKDTKLPADFVARYAKETTLAQMKWQEAREKSDFAIFQPNLETLVEMAKEGAEYYAPYDHVYDPLLDIYEPGMKTAEVKKIFEALRPQQVELIQAILDKPQIDDSFFHLHYPRQAQWDFGIEVLKALGFEMSHGRQDYSAHPFTTSFGLKDVRLTTRIFEDHLVSGLMSTMHEGGHGLYEMGYDPAHAYDTLHGAASLAIHESQSRMWENLVGRSLPFWKHFYPKLQQVFPAQLNNVSLDAFYKAINKVQPSLIRVEADEATYNLHIMLRLEVEIGLLEGSIKVSQLPEFWNSKMREFFNLTPPDDAHGVLQDIHWSDGLFGYFATYALGNLVSVQLWDAMKLQIPNLLDNIEKGDFAEMLQWLRQNIHIHGCKYEPQELIERVTGSRITPEPYMRYLRQKYSDIYGL